MLTFPIQSCCTHSGRFNGSSFSESSASIQKARLKLRSGYLNSWPEIAQGSISSRSSLSKTCKEYACKTVLAFPSREATSLALARPQSQNPNGSQICLTPALVTSCPKAASHTEAAPFLHRACLRSRGLGALLDKQSRERTDQWELWSVGFTALPSTMQNGTACKALTCCAFDWRLRILGTLAGARFPPLARLLDHSISAT